MNILVGLPKVSTAFENNQVNCLLTLGALSLETLAFNNSSSIIKIMQKSFQNNRIQRSKIMKMVSQRIGRSPSPSIAGKSFSTYTSQTPVVPRQQINLLQVVQSMQKQINQLNKVILSMQNSNNESRVSTLMQQKDRQLNIHKEQLRRNQKQIKQLIQQNHKRSRQIQYLRLQMSRSLSLSEASNFPVSSQQQILGNYNLDESVRNESIVFKQNVSRIPKRTFEEVVSPLSMSLAKENCKIQDSKAFIFQQFE